MPYDSVLDTRRHIEAVRKIIWDICYRFQERAGAHDRSKLESPEKEWLDEVVPKLKATQYGSLEYTKALEDNSEILAYHYTKNSHHPEHHEAGIAGMSLLDLIEMLADWQAATSRHLDGDIHQSLEVNRKRFGIEPQLYAILVATVKEMGW